jgi:hypothetical protein
LPFTVTLPPPYLETVFTTEANEHHYLEVLRQTGLSDLLKDPKACLTKVCEQYEALRLSEWLNDVAKKPDNDPVRSAVERCLHELDKLAAPAWDYQDAWVSNPRVADREQVHILGLENGTDDDSPLLPGRPLSHVFAGNIQQRNKLKVVRTGQPDRVYLYKIEASIPAFVLRNIEMYRERYQDLRSMRSFHTDRRWEPKLPPLDPLPTETEAAGVWVKARLFAFVRQQGTYQCVGETTNGGERWHQLGRTLGQAFEAFARNFTLFRELQYRVREKELTWRQERHAEYCQRVEEAIQQRRDRLNILKTNVGANGDREPAERQHDAKVVQLELEALEKLREQLGSVREDLEDPFPTLG